MRLGLHPLSEANLIEGVLFCVKRIVMDEQQYRIWWELHRRVSKGETLSDEDNQIYLAGRSELEAEEWASLPRIAEAVRPLQERLRELRERNQNLVQQEATLGRRATELEVRYLALTGEPLGIDF